MRQKRRSPWRSAARPRARILGRLSSLELLESRELLAGDLVAHWHADDLTALLADGAQVDSWPDRIAQRSADRLDGSPRLAFNQLGGRATVRFDASDGGDNLIVPAAASPLSGADDFSVLVAFVTTATDLRGGTRNWYQNTGLVDGSQLGMRQDWGISLNTAGQVAAGIGRDLMEPAATVYSSSTGLNDGQLHVATFTRQQGTIQLYVDGGSANSRSDADDRPRSSQGLAIGSLLTQQGFFSGQIGEVRVYNGCLSAEEVSQLTSQVVTYYSNQLPVASADEYQLPEDQVLAVPAAESVLANDTDGDGDSLTAVLVQPATHGQLDLEADGSFTYRPAANFAGEDVFSYRSSDGIGRSAEVVVRIDVQPVNDRPLAQPETYVGLMNEVLRIEVPQGVLANDVDVDGPSLQAILTAGPAHGRVDLQHDGSFVYTPDPGFGGLDQFGYRATDSLSSTELVVVTIQTTTQPILITEFMASNAETVETRLRTDTSRAFEGEVLSPDWIELRNVLSQPWDVGGLYLTDDAQRPQKWQFPVGTIVAPDGYLVVFASGREVRDPAFDQRGWLHTTFELSSSPGYLALVSTGGKVIHELVYPQQRTHVSYGVQELDPRQVGYFVQPTPGAANGIRRTGLVADTQFSVDRGFFAEPIQVQIVTATPEATIRYTTDGTPPSDTLGQIYTGPLTIDRTTTLRAVAYREGLVTTNVDTQSYIFVKDVVEQTAQSTLAAGFPSSWRGTPPDYGMDDPSQFPRIAGNVSMPLDQAKQAIADSLLAVPTLSIVLKTDEMFGTQGIYSNPENTGERWERATSVELLQPDGSEGFQIDAGIRIQGGAFRSFGLTKKNSLRLIFKTKYGPDKLRYPLFGPDAVDEFDTVTLRMEANDGWQWGDAGGQPQYARDEFLRRTQLAMGQPAPHGTSMHVYINGFYWGLYNLVERPDQSFGAAYFGAEPYSWDGINSGETINADGDRFRNTRTQNAWRTMQNLARDVQRAATQQEKTALLMKLQGLNPDGSDNPDQQDFLDLENMIDYLIVNYYGDNRDWPFKNYYVGRENNSDSTGFKFFTWDAEWSLLLRSSVTGNNITDNQGVAIPFQYLRTSDEFRVLFGDRVHEHFSPGGALYVDPQHPQWDPTHPERNVPAARYVEWTHLIYDALLAESARWGDQHRTTPYTRNVDWQREFDRVMRDWFPKRSVFLVDAFRKLQLYPAVQAVTFNQQGGAIGRDFPIALSAPQGTIYYTLDGSDPRQLGGAVQPAAIRYTGPFQLLQNGTVKARVLDGQSWSALDEATFAIDVVPADASNLRIAEVHYHPGAPTAAEIAAGFDDADEFEFLELVNISQQTLDLSQVALRVVDVNGQPQGVEFRLADGQILQLGPQERLVVVENLAAFRARYGDGLPVAGQWSGGLSNNREQVTLVAGEELLQQFTYDDRWYRATDGAGGSLEIIDPAGAPATWNDPRAWRASSKPEGSPGAAPRVLGDVNGDGLFDSSDLTAIFAAGKYEDDIAQNSRFDEGDWNGDGEFDSNDIILAFQAGHFEALAAAVATRRAGSACRNQQPPAEPIA